MARLTTGLPSNLYSGGAVTLNSQPYVNYYLQTQQRRQAQDDALYKYFGDLGKNITPAGMHSNDIPDLMAMKQAWQKYALEHKNEIARPSLDRGNAYQTSMGMYNNMLSHAEMSKQKVKNLHDVYSIYKDPTKRGLLTEQSIADISKGELPITDPNYRPIDLGDVAYNHKPFDINEQNKLTALLNRFRGNKVYEGAAQPIPGSNRERLKFRYDFAPDQLRGIYNIGASLYHSNPGFKDMIDQEADPLSNNYEPLNDLFKKHYGKDIASPEDMAAAHTLSLHPNKEGGEEERNKTYNPFDLIAARNASAKDVIDYRGQKKQQAVADANSDIDKLMGSISDDAKLHPMTVRNAKDGLENHYYKANVTPEFRRMFSYKDSKGHPVDPDDIFISKDGSKYLPVFYTGGKAQDGAKTIDVENSKPTLTSEVRVRVAKQLAGVKAAAKAIQTTPAATSKPSKDPLKLF